MMEKLMIAVYVDESPGWAWIALEQFNPEIHSVCPVGELPSETSSTSKSPVLGEHDVHCC